MTRYFNFPWGSLDCSAVRQWACLLGIFLPGLLAASPSVSLQFDELGEQDLGVQRGRFASDGQIVNFGVEMLSSWQTGDGAMLRAGVRLQVDARLAPTLTVMGSADVRQSAQAGATTYPAFGGIENVHGIAQSIQIAGDGNSVINGMQIDMTQTTSQIRGEQVALAGPGIYSQDSGGGVSTVKLEKNSLSLFVDLPGHGRTFQRLSARGLQQNTLINSDLNRVSNEMRLTATVRPAAASVGGAMASFSNLRGLGLPGGM